MKNELVEVTAVRIIANPKNPDDWEVRIEVSEIDWAVVDSTGEVVEWAIDSTGELLDAPATLPRMADGRSDYGGNLLNAIRDSIEHVQADIARLEGH